MNPNAREHIEKILAHMTQLPGVYKMLGKDGELLYVGKVVERDFDPLLEIDRLAIWFVILPAEDP